MRITRRDPKLPFSRAASLFLQVCQIELRGLLHNEKRARPLDFLDVRPGERTSEWQGPSQMCSTQARQSDSGTFTVHIEAYLRHNLSQPGMWLALSRHVFKCLHHGTLRVLNPCSGSTDIFFAPSLDMHLSDSLFQLVTC